MYVCVCACVHVYAGVLSDIYCAYLFDPASCVLQIRVSCCVLPHVQIEYLYRLAVM